MSPHYIRYAPDYIIGVLACGVLAIVFKSKGLFVLTLVFTVCLLVFFRGVHSLPSESDRDPRILYCPCDGVVSDIRYHPDGRTQISIFLNIHNIHVQYSPFKCTVKSITHTDGSFHPAFLLEKSQHNERTEYVLQNAVFGEVVLIQIAGQLARSIVSFVHPNSRLDVFSPIGMIKLGSRCDVVVANRHQPPLVLVQKGDRVRIGDPLIVSASASAFAPVPAYANPMGSVGGEGE